MKLGDASGSSVRWKINIREPCKAALAESKSKNQQLEMKQNRSTLSERNKGL